MSSSVVDNAQLNIVLCGLSFSSPNLGCGALAYAFRSILIETLRSENIDVFITVLSNVDCEDYVKAEEAWVHENIIRYSFKNLASMRMSRRAVRNADVVIDFTEGDSFSDIYGVKRFIVTSYFKYIAIHSNAALMLGPQTYGPFKRKIVQHLAGKLISRADKVYARDQKSAQLVRSIVDTDIVTTTDVAFSLPVGYCDVPEHNRPKFGLNVSGLLWTGGYTESNQFGLTVNYREYIHKLMDAVTERGYEVHLIPHVVTDLYPECDSPICKKLAAEHDNCVVAPDFVSPMQAKGYISHMDVFSGARMHSTVGAFSSGVLTAPFSYSPKFEGLYGSIGYPYTINARALTTDEAIDTTLDYLDSPEKYREAQAKALSRAKTNIDSFSNDLQKWLKDILAMKQVEKVDAQND